jgi:hypothetical protein
MQTTEGIQQSALLLYVDLAGEQLDALEQLRGGGSLFFLFDLRVLVQSQIRGTQSGFEKRWFEATVSNWSKVLQQLGYLEWLLIAVELPISVVAELKPAVDALRAAHQDLIGARYDACIGRCRIAMDALETIVGYGSPIADARQAFASKADREAMTKRARADLVRLAVRHYTHLAHHVGGAGATGNLLPSGCPVYS